MRFAPIYRSYHLLKKSKLLQTLFLDFLHILQVGAKLTEGTKFESELTIRVYSLRVLEVGAFGTLKVHSVSILDEYIFHPKQYRWKLVRTKVAEFLNQDISKVYPIRREFQFTYQAIAGNPESCEVARVRGSFFFEAARIFLERFKKEFHEECHIYYFGKCPADNDFVTVHCTNLIAEMTKNSIE